MVPGVPPRIGFHRSPFQGSARVWGNLRPQGVALGYRWLPRWGEGPAAQRARWNFHCADRVVRVRLPRQTLEDAPPEGSMSTNPTPHGGLISSSGPLAGANTMRFSSKPAILSATGAWGFYYYGYRFYDPGMQRWLNRDPLGEVDGNHLYTFIRNLPVSWVDPFGLKIEYGDDSDREGAKQTIECWKKTLPKEANLLKLISEIESAKSTLEIKSMDGRNNANGDPISTPETVFNKVTKTRQCISISSHISTEVQTILGQ